MTRRTIKYLPLLAVTFTDVHVTVSSATIDVFTPGSAYGVHPGTVHVVSSLPVEGELAGDSADCHTFSTF